MAYEFIELNLIPTGEKPVFHAAQYDVGRPIIIKLKNGEDDFTPTGLDLELQVRKVDNNIVTSVPDSVDGNVVTFFSTQQMTACSGTNLCEVQLSDGSTTIATLHFYLVVQRDVLQGGLTSQSEIHDLEEQIAAIVPEVIGDEYYTAEEVDEKIAEIPTFDPTNYYTKSQLYTKTETNGLLSQKANTSSLATVATSGSYNDLTNKPTIPDVSNYYTKSETYSQDEVNTLLSAKADTSSLKTVATTGDYDDLINKPTIPAAQVQSDWSQADNTQVDFIKNKPTIPTNAELLPIDALHPNDNTKDYIDGRTASDIEYSSGVTVATAISSENSPNTASYVYMPTVTEPTLDSGASHNNRTWYYKHGFRVCLSIGVKSLNTGVSNQDLFSLPVGYRPRNTLSLVCSGFSFDKKSVVIILADGTVRVTATEDQGAFAYIEFDAYS